MLTTAQIRAAAERKEEIDTLYVRPEGEAKKNIHFDIDITEGGVEKEWKEEDPEVFNHVERHFKFYEIVNSLKQICYDQMEPIR